MEISENRYYDSRLYCLLKMTFHLGNSLSLIKTRCTGVILTEEVGACFGKAATGRYGSSAGFFIPMAGLKGPILTSDGGIRRESANGSSLRFTSPSSSCFLMRLSGPC